MDLTPERLGARGPQWAPLRPAMSVASSHSPAVANKGAVPVLLLAEELAAAPQARWQAPPRPEGAAADARAPRAEHAAPEDRAMKSSISMLQEFVQCARVYQAPQQRPVLQWHLESRLGASLAATAEFRATVSFLLDGVPHHVVGAWHPSKKRAQRDTAERTLGLYVGRWGAEALQEPGPQPCLTLMQRQRRQHAGGRSGHEARVLEDFCRGSPAVTGGTARWEVRWEVGLCRAHLELSILGVPHTFSGAARHCVEAARDDAARRVLWYLQCPGFENAFEPNLQALDVPPPPPSAAALDISAQPPGWAGHAAKAMGSGYCTAQAAPDFPFS